MAAVLVSVTCAACAVLVIWLYQICCYRPPVVRTAAIRRPRLPKGQSTRRARRRDHVQRQQLSSRTGSRPAAAKHQYQSRRALAAAAPEPVDEDTLLTFGSCTIHAVEDGCNVFKFRRAVAGETVEVYEVDDEITPDDSVSVAMWNNMQVAPLPLPSHAPCRCKCARPLPGGRGRAGADGGPSERLYASQAQASSSSSSRRGLGRMAALPELSEGPTSASAAPTCEAQWTPSHAQSKLAPLLPPPPYEQPAVRRPPALVPAAAPAPHGRLRQPLPSSAGGDDMTMVALSTMPRRSPNTRSL